MGGTVDGNPDLKAETSRSFDTGLEWKDGKTAWTISWFDQKVKNLIDYEEMAGSSMEYRYVNRKQAELKGLEGEISYSFCRAGQCGAPIPIWMAGIDPKTHGFPTAAATPP